MLNLPRNQKYLLACSYGPDSMALFSILLNEKYDFEVAHVNYHLRSESNDETNGLKTFCFDHQIKLHIFEVKEDLGCSNLEAKCRDIRYSFFKNICDKNNIKSVLVAHNQDDHIETYYLQKRRKNLVKFYGIAENTNILGLEIIRPLLAYKKEYLTQYCLSNSVPFAIDKTNLDNTFERNKIRHSIVETMNDNSRKEIVNEIKEKNNELALLLSELESYDLNDVKTLLSFDDIKLAYALNHSIEKLGVHKSISFPFIKEFKKVLLSEKSNVLIKINKDISFIKEYEKCRFILNSINEYEFVLTKPDVLDTPYFYLNFKNDSSNRNVYISDYPITIRNARSGDMYLIKDYKKQVRRLFIDWKVPLSKRATWPVIVSHTGKIIYIPRYQKDFKPTNDCNLIVK